MNFLDLFSVGSAKYSTKWVEKRTETNILTRNNKIKNPNWLEANQLAVYTGIWVRNYWECGFCVLLREQAELAVRAGLRLGASGLHIGSTHPSRTHPPLLVQKEFCHLPFLCLLS